MKKIKFFLFTLIFIVLLLPVLQKIYPIIKLNSLGGAYTPIEKPVFSISDWFSEKYQQQYNKYLEENIGFREFLYGFTIPSNFASTIRPMLRVQLLVKKAIYLKKIIF